MRFLLTIAAATMLALVPAVVAAADPPPGVVVKDGVTQPVFGYDDAIREHVWVESTFDSDHDGERDLISLDIMRPRATEQGLKVPVIMDASPYYSTLGRGNESELKKDTDGDGLLDKWPLFYDNYFVPRGYAVVLLDMVGTNNSTGCPTTNGTPDNLSAKVAIDWLNGRAKAHDASGNPVTADWHNGRTGMVGKSYDGNLALATAVTGVQGLSTIVDISGPSNYYKYTRENGVVTRGNHYVAQLAQTVTDPDRRDHCKAVRDELSAADGDATGDYSAFWDERNYVKDAGNVRASVFMVHGRNDDNVRPDHFSDFWSAIAARGVARKLWLSEEGHVDPFDFRRSVWVDTLHRWFDRWLWEVPNRIMAEPTVDLERGPDKWETYPTWPVPGSARTHLWFRNGADGAGGAGGFGLAALPGRPTTAAFDDDPAQTETQMIADPSAENSHRLAYLSPPLAAPLHVSGVPLVRLRASADKTDTNLGAVLVDYGTQTRVGWERPGEGITTLTSEDCWGESSPADDACYKQTIKNVITADRERVSKGVMDALNRNSLTEPEPLVPGQAYDFTLPLLPVDHVFPAGHRLGLVVVGSYRNYSSVPDQTRAHITVNTKTSNLDLPVVGGRQSAARAGF